MCYNGKCLHCIPVKTACLVLGIINAVINGLILVWYIFVFLFMLMLFGGGSVKIGGVRFKRDASDDESKYYIWMVYFQVFLIPTVALLNLIFSSILCNGICNRKPKQVKAYFWYGVVFTVLAAIAAVLLLCTDLQYRQSMPWETDETRGVCWLVGCVIHAMFLVLVHETHKKVAEDAMLNGHIRLVEDKELTYPQHQIKV